MGPISRAISTALDKLPKWANLILDTCLPRVGVLHRYGMFLFLPRMIFTPLP